MRSGASASASPVQSGFDRRTRAVRGRRGPVDGAVRWRAGGRLHAGCPGVSAALFDHSPAAQTATNAGGDGAHAAAGPAQHPDPGRPGTAAAVSAHHPGRSGLLSRASAGSGAVAAGVPGACSRIAWRTRPGRDRNRESGLVAAPGVRAGGGSGFHGGPERPLGIRARGRIADTADGARDRREAAAGCSAARVHRRGDAQGRGRRQMDRPRPAVDVGGGDRRRAAGGRSDRLR